MQSRDEGHGASPSNRRPSSPLPIRAKRSAPDSRALPLSRNKTIRDRLNWKLGRDETIRPRPGARSRTLQQRLPNRETLGDRPVPPTVPQRATDRPEQAVERGEQDGETGPEKNDARVDNEPLHREVNEAGTGVPTTRELVLGAHTTRAVERARKRNAIAESHFQSNLSNWMGWYVTISHCHTISHNVNIVLLQYAPNLLNILHVNAGNANVTVNLAVTVLNNFKLKRDTVQAKNNLPTQ